MLVTPQGSAAVSDLDTSSWKFPASPECWHWCRSPWQCRTCSWSLGRSRKGAASSGWRRYRRGYMPVLTSPRCSPGLCLLATWRSGIRALQKLRIGFLTLFWELIFLRDSWVFKSLIDTLSLFSLKCSIINLLEFIVKLDQPFCYKIRNKL